MKICHISSVHDYRDTRITLKECISLKEAGNEVHLIAKNDQDINYKGIKLHSIKEKKQSRIKRIISSTNEFYAKALEIDADIYHFHDPELIPLGKKLIKKGKKVIYDVHEDVPRQIMTKHWIPKIFRGLISRVFEVYENYSASKFTGIVTATPHIRNRFTNKNENVIDIKNYPILKELFVNTEDSQNEKDNAMVYIGGISEVRGIFSMLDSLDNLSNIEFKLAGSFSNRKEYLQAKESKNWNMVNYDGFVGREDIKEILTKSKVGLVVLHPLISYQDSLPIKMFEYMAVGLPVVASNFPLWEDIINKHKCGICVNPKSSKEISNAVQWIIDNPKEAKKMGERGKKAVQDQYNWEIESIRLIEYYNDL